MDREEVKGMLLTEYDEAKHFQKIKEEGREEGRLTTLIDLVRSDDLSMEKAAQKLGIPVSEFEKILQEK